MHPTLTSQLASARTDDLLRPAATHTPTLFDRLIAPARRRRDDRARRAA